MGGRYIKTMYGRQWKSAKDEQTENLAIGIIGLFVVIIFLILNP